MDNNNIHIFFASDNNFVLPLYNALSSILRNANVQDNLNFYILDKDISENNKNKIKNLKKVKPFNIEYIKINDDLFKDCPLLKICGHISLQTYYRYIIPRVKPNLPKVLYLDCDILVKSSLSDLWNIDLKDTYCGAVQELYKDSNIDARRLNVKTYFNAGVLLLNNKKMIEDNTTDELFRVTKDLYESGNLVYQDQDVLNVVFNDNITWMSPRFNYQQNMSGDSSEKIYSQTELEYAKRNVVLVHYNSGIKPWLGNYDSSFFFKDYYMELFRNGFYYKLYQLFLKSAVNNLFSITNIISDGKKFKQVTIMGIKIKVKKNSDVQIFVSYHKPFKLFKNKYLQPIHVGRDVFLNKDTCDGDYQKIKKWLLKNTIGDNTSDNISLKNPNYCELTAQYWAWKNCNANYVGFCHYRRLFDLNNSKISKLLNEYDIILPRIFTLDCTVREQYNRDHIKEDLDKTLEIIASKYPDYMEDAENVLNKKTIYFCNMFITNRELFNSYCEWLFDILFELEKVTVISENKYQSRIFGFLSERLLNIFIEHVKRIDDIKICEVPVKFIEENKFSFLQRLFSVTNEGYHKIIMILGMKFKLKNKIKELISRIDELKCKLDKNEEQIVQQNEDYKTFISMQTKKNEQLNSAIVNLYIRTNVALNSSSNMDNLFNNPIVPYNRCYLDTKISYINYLFDNVNGSFDNSLQLNENPNFFYTCGTCPNSENAEIIASALKYGKKAYIIEDCFLRSIFSVAYKNIEPKYQKSIGFTIDDLTSYYDASYSTRLEQMLNDKNIVISDEQKMRAKKCIEKIISTHLSKYNNQPIFEPQIGRKGVKKVLVVDQSYGDMSISRGWGSEEAFRLMLEQARNENPDADIIVKTHPDTISGTRGGYYTGLAQHDNIYPMTEPINPISLIKYCDKVYVCTTQFGFEALMCGKEVHVFGMPFYAGWGLTHDRQKCERRTNTRTLEEVFYIAYIMYSYYVNPDKKCRCEIEEAMDYLLKLRDEYFENLK